MFYPEVHCYKIIWTHVTLTTDIYQPHCQGPVGTTSPVSLAPQPAPCPGHPVTLRVSSLCPSQATAGQGYSFQPWAAGPWAAPSWAHPEVQSSSWAWPARACGLATCMGHGCFMTCALGWAWPPAIGQPHDLLGCCVAEPWIWVPAWLAQGLLGSLLPQRAALLREQPCLYLLPVSYVLYVAKAVQENLENVLLGSPYFLNREDILYGH